jgi:sialate O-acetylesterase
MRVEEKKSEKTRIGPWSILGFCLLFIAQSISLGDVRIAGIFGDGMVLQQQAAVTIWGQASPFEEVQIKASWEGAAVHSKADRQGKWTTKLETPSAGGPYKICIKAKNEIVLNDVLVGEVWICAGQSNMEMGIWAVDNAEQEIKAANYPNIRLFHFKRIISAEPVRQTEGKWYLCSPENVSSQGDWAGFSAAGYFFGREIHKNLNVPVGLIQVAWGGTPAEAWMSKESLLSDPDFEPIVKKIPKTYSPEEIKNSEQEQEQWFKRLNTPSPDEAGWMAPHMNEQGWKTMRLPQTWEDAGLLLDGVVWFRTNVTIPLDWSGKDLVLSLGPIDDKDTTWFNGKQVGQTDSWNANREYRIPSSLISSEKNVIAVRVFDSGGQGGIYGTPKQLKLYPVGESDGKGISLAGNWLYKIGVNPGPKPEIKGQNPNKPTVLYNGMVTPLIPYRIRGVVWYQGESNCERAFQYRKLFPALINNWRTVWNQGNFPFYYVQIAPFISWYKPFECAELRESQLMALSVPNTGMIVTSDIGNLTDVHPKNKQDVGKRLALWALAKTYGQDIVCSGPLYKSMQVEDDKIRIFFNYSDGGLMMKGPKLTCFTIAGSDRKFAEAQAVIDGNTVVVSSDTIKQPVAVRFAWSNTDEPNLFNKAGLPASLFRTDDWPGVTVDKRDPSF